MKAKKFVALSAVWLNGFPTKVKEHALSATSWHKADREVENLSLTDDRKLWAYGPAKTVRANAKVNLQQV